MSGIELICQYEKGKLVPRDSAQDELANQSLMQGKDLLCRISYPRNPKQHRLLFALLKLISENSEAYDTTGKALVALKIATGHVEPIAFDNKIYMQTKSISFAAMSQAEFRPWFDNAINVACKKLIEGTKAKDLRNEIFLMTGIEI